MTPRPAFMSQRSKYIDRQPSPATSGERSELPLNSGCRSLLEIIDALRGEELGQGDSNRLFLACLVLIINDLRVIFFRIDQILVARTVAGKRIEALRARPAWGTEVLLY